MNFIAVTVRAVLNEDFELPSLEEIEQMERQRLQSSVRCGNAKPIVGKLPRPHNDRVVILQRRIKWMENYYHGANVNDLKALRQELADLLEEDAKYDKLRSLPL